MLMKMLSKLATSTAIQKAPNLLSKHKTDDKVADIIIIALLIGVGVYVTRDIRQRPRMKASSIKNETGSQKKLEVEATNK